MVYHLSAESDAEARVKAESYAVRYARKFNTTCALKELSKGGVTINDTHIPGLGEGYTTTPKGETERVCIRTTQCDVYCGRPSEWGNPFSHKPGAGTFYVPTVEEAVASYRRWVVKQPHLMAQLHTLEGKRLGCWCAPGKPCHTDVLVELVEQMKRERDG